MGQGSLRPPFFLESMSESGSECDLPGFQGLCEAHPAAAPAQKRGTRQDQSFLPSSWEVNWLSMPIGE